MANKFYSLARATFGTDFGAALTDYYGVGVTIHYSSATDIVFTCPTLFNKVIRISKIQQIFSTTEWFDQLICQYGTAWTSGTTLTNAVSFCGNARTGSNIDMSLYIETADLILGADFLLIHFEGGRPQMAILNKLSNGEFVALGYNHEAAYSTNTHGYSVDGDGSEIVIVTMNPSFNDNGYLVKSPIYFCKKEVGGLNAILNSDNSYATVNNMKIVGNNPRIFLADNYFMTLARQWYSNAGYSMINGSLFIDLTP